MLEYRVTKYDPALRDLSGAYTWDEWTSVSDIGRTFGETTVTRSEYQRVEDAYVEAALAFMREAGVSALRVVGLEAYHSRPRIREGSLLHLPRAGQTIRRVLREEYWCKLEAPEAFLHFGYDYYMYIGVPRACTAAEDLAFELGLFVEPFPSPYRESDLD